MSQFFSAWTVVAALIFAGVTAWALSSSRKSEFDAAAQIPLDDEKNSTEKTEA
jgi:cbb3-type cytochrome oxidase subunit 3